MFKFFSFLFFVTTLNVSFISAEDYFFSQEELQQFFYEGISLNATHMVSYVEVCNGDREENILYIFPSDDLNEQICILRADNRIYYMKSFNLAKPFEHSFL